MIKAYRTTDHNGRPYLYRRLADGSIDYLDESIGPFAEWESVENVETCELSTAELRAIADCRDQTDTPSAGVEIVEVPG